MRWPLAALLTILVAAIGGLIGTSHRLASGSRARTSSPIARSALARQGNDHFQSLLKPGPWGNLEVWPITLERPDMMLSNVAGYFQDRPWRFLESSAEELGVLFAGPDLTEEQRQWLADRNHWQNSGAGFSIAPPVELIEGLSAAARLRIYSVLSGHAENIFQSTPFMFSMNESDAWFANSGLVPGTVAQVRRLCYQRGNLLCFSDLAVVGRHLAESEKLRLLKALSRVVAVFARVQISADSDISALVGYWGKSADPGDIQSILECVRRTRDGGTVDISYLLTDFARQRLYTYPRVIDPLSTKKDCFWTALNYHNEVPDNRFLDANFRLACLQSNYVAVATEPMVGDVMVFTDAQGAVVHACVYVAADLLFTKNGATPFAPWLLMKAADVLAYYSADGPLRIGCYRMKRPPSQAGASVLTRPADRVA